VLHPLLHIVSGKRLPKRPKAQKTPTSTRVDEGVALVEPGKISLHIETSPKESRVYVDDRLIGRAPVVVEATPLDILHLRVSKKRYRSRKLEVRAEGQSLTVKLEKR